MATITAVAVLLLVQAAVARPLERWNISSALFFTLGGFALGPCTGLLDLSPGSHDIQLLAEVTLTLVLFADASRITAQLLRRELALPARLLGIGLPLTIVAGAAAGVAVLPGLSWNEALVLAVMLACTDAALGKAVVTDSRVPPRIRHALNVESGLNDGLCVPLLALAVAAAGGTSGSISHAIIKVVEELSIGALGGIVAGVLGAAALHRATQRATPESITQLVPLATAALAAGLASMLGASIFIGAFCAGLTFASLTERVREQTVTPIDDVGQLASAVTFVFFGLILGRLVGAVTLPIAGYAVLSLTLVRMVPVALALVGTRARLPTVAFLGWFGPRGLASIVFAVLVLDGSDLPHEQLILATAALTVAASIVAHSLSARPFTDRYAAWKGADPRRRRLPVEGHALGGSPS